MENTKTSAALRFNLRWLLKALIPTLANKESRIIVIGTPQCEGCMILKLFKLPGWTTRCYDSIVDEDTHEVIWPEGCSYDFIMGEKADAEAAGELSTWYSEYRCTIISDEEQLFKPEYFRFYRGWLEPDRMGKAYLHITHLAHKKADLDEGEMEVEDIRPVCAFMGVDPASSEARRADRSVNFPIVMDKDENVFCLPYFYKRVPPTEHAQAIIEDYESYYPLRTTIEAIGYQEALRDILRKRSHYFTKDGKPIRIPGLESKTLPREKKTKRHKTALHEYFYHRRVFMLEGMEAFEQELQMWREDKTQKDDLIDGFYYALFRTYTPEHEYKGDGKRTYSRESDEMSDDDWFYA